MTFRWLLMLFLSGLFLVSCTARITADRYYTIPDGYTGFLVIYYDCPNGQPIRPVDQQIHITFRADGSFCAATPYQRTSGQVFAQSAMGQSIRVVGSPWNETGYALYPDQMLLIAGGPNDPEYRFSILWVGDMQQLAALRNERPYTEELDLFLEQRFGVRTGR